MEFSAKNLDIVIKSMRKKMEERGESPELYLVIPSKIKIRFIKRFPWIKIYTIPHPKYFKEADICQKK